jgi:hypothetical protein
MNRINRFLICSLTSLLFCISCAEKTESYADLDLNGEWEYGLDREYQGVCDVPGITLDPEEVTKGTLWYKRLVELPVGDWNTAVLELKGARFRPAVYIDGNKSSHFNPITDTFRIYRQLLMSALGSIISIAVIELMLFYGSTFWDIIVKSPLIFIYSIPSIGLFSCLVNIIFTKSIFLRNIHTRDYLKIFLRTMVRFLVYMLCCYLIFLWLPSLPMIINYNIVVALLIIPEYFIIKWISILIGKTKGNK